MIPLRDINPTSRWPVITVGLIIANVLVFLYQLPLGPQGSVALYYSFGIVPARLSLALTSPQVSLADAFLPFFSSMFLHGGFWHLLGNMWFLWVFGDNIEDRLGHLRFAVFYVLCGVGAGMAHAVANWGSTVPAVGASGAISGVLGAYFILFPHSRVITLVPLLFVFFTVRLPAVLILGYWFLIQFASGLESLGTGRAEGVAWWAHIGGFLLGALLIKVLRPRRKGW